MGGGDANVAGNNDGDNSKNNENSAAAACGSDGEAVNINIRCSNGSKFSVQATLDSSVGSFKSLLAQHCDIPSEQQRLIYKGRILKDEQTLDSYGLKADHTVHLVRGFAPATSTNNAGATSPGAPNTNQNASRDAAPNVGGAFGGSGPGASLFPGLNLNGLGSGGGGGLFGAGLPDFEQVQQQLNQNPNMMRDILNMPLVQNLMNNPEVIRNLIMNNPQMREIMDRNPELAHILNDPATLRQTMEAARNPELMREMMRNTDRAMSNIESSPEGFNMLRRMYETVQEPFLNATTMAGDARSDVGSNPFAALLGVQGGGQGNPPAVLFRIIIMFLIGLEMDFPYFLRKLRQVGIIACGSSLMCTFFAAAITSFVYQETTSHGSAFMMGLMITIILASTASPVVIRLAADLKFATSDIGRMAISSALINDAYGVVLLFAISKTRQHYSYATWVFLGFLYLFTVGLVVVVNKYVANWMNRRNRNQKYLKNAEMFGLLAILYIVAMSLELMGFSSLIFSFLIGSMFPRGGKAARTLLIKLTYPVHNFILPIYFGYLGFKANVAYIDSIRNFCVVFFIMLLSFGGKIVGTLAACYHLKIPYYEGVLMAFLMNLKGHVDLLALTIGSTNKIILSDTFYGLMVSAVVINSLVWGPIIAFMVRREHDIIGYRQIYFETQAPECELRLLACVHGPRPVATMVGLIAASRGPESVPLTPYLMHLVELPGKSNTTLMYNQKEEDEVSDDDDYGGNEVVEINDAVDIFTAETGVMVHQMKAVSPLSSMYKDVCDHAEDIRASVILLPFHKHQRIDGKLETSKDGIRTTNQKVLRFAPCAVAILVDRGLTAGSLNITNTDSLQHIATLFFGGPDDREALGFSKRLGMHNHINLTVIRFLSASAKEQNVGVDIAHKEENVLMAISDRETETEADNEVLSEFYHRYVTSGQVGYVEKHVENGSETASALRDMADMYSLIVVGKEGRGYSPLITGISDWEECPELGKVGDFLASAEFDFCGSVLVMQQHRPTKHEDDD